MVVLCEKNICIRFQYNLIIPYTIRNFLLIWNPKGYPIIVGSEIDCKKYCFVISFYTDFTIDFQWKSLLSDAHLNFGFQVMGLPFISQNGSDIQIFYNNLSKYCITQQKSNLSEILVQEILHIESDTASSNTVITLPRSLECRNSIFQYTPSNFSPLLFENKAQFAGFHTIPVVFWPKLKVAYTLHDRITIHHGENNRNFYFSSETTLGFANLFCLKSDGGIYFVFSNGTPYIHTKHKLFFLSDDVFISSSKTSTELILFEIGSNPVRSIKN